MIWHSGPGDSLYESAIEHETGIVWKDNPLLYRNVREAVILHDSRSRAPGRYIVIGRIVGYATLSRAAQPHLEHGRYLRRIFWVRNFDDYSGVDLALGCPPEEGVLTDSVKFGQPSRPGEPLPN